MTFLKSFLSFLCIAVILCACYGAFLWLERTAIEEPVWTYEYRGETLSIQSGQKEYVLSLRHAERAAEQIQRLWILLPRGFRLSLQGLTWLYLQK